MAVSKAKVPGKTAVKARKAIAKPVVRQESKAEPVRAKAAKSAPEPRLPAKVKTKLVRDSFTIPRNEYVVLETLKKRAALLACPAKKSEILRAGLNVLNSLPDPAFFAAIGAVPNLKTGRPNKDE